MTSLISPGVDVREIDLTTIVPSVSTTEGALAGLFRWGAVDTRMLIDSEVDLVQKRGKPTNYNSETWFVGASFLAYGNKLYTTRVGNTAGVTPTPTCNVAVGNANVSLTTGNTDLLEVGMFVINAANGGLANGATIASIINSTAFVIDTASEALATSTTEAIQFVSNTLFSAVANTGAVANLEYSTITNEADWDLKDGTIDTDVSWIARYPGDMGNSLRVSVCGNAAGYTSDLNLASYGTVAYLNVNTNSNTANVNFVSAANADNSANSIIFRSLVNVSDLIKVGNTTVGEQYLKVTALSALATYGTVGTNVAITTTVGSTTVTSNNTTDLAAGMYISAGNSTVTGLVVASVTNATSFVSDTAASAVLTASEVTIDPRASFTINFEDRYSQATNHQFISSNTTTRTISRYWEFFNYIDLAPSLSDYQIAFGNNSVTNDEMHIVVTDNDGSFTGVPGTVLETYEAISRATDAKTTDGGGNFYKDIINQSSQYVYIANDLTGAVSNTATNLISSTLDVSVLNLTYGNDGKDESTIEIGEITGGYDLYKSPEDIADVALIMQGKARSFSIANYITDNICEHRKDCIALISPQKSDVVNNTGNETDAVIAFRNNLRSTSYGVLDSGYKYMYDRYNDIYRWVPMNGDTAGLCVRTDNTNDPWWSPAGFNRGQIKNIVKLAWNPRQAHRDELYKNGINPMVTFPGQGTIMYGDKTLLSKPSAFDRINVRRLFIVLEKAISRASKFTLFEFNDEFTRLQFKSLIVPYLRDVQGRRGVTDFLVVCDGTNNTPEVIDGNEFIGDIYIKPARSINFIRLNFIAVRTGVAFSEIVGQF
jgi:hypothetical protein